MKRVMIKLSNGLHYICLSSAIASLGVMLFAVCIQVVARYAFQSPPAWTEELARYAMVWCGLLGATASLKTNADPALFEHKDSQSAIRNFLRRRVIESSVIIFMVPVIYFCFFGLGEKFSQGYIARMAVRESAVMRIPMIWVAIAVPICAVVVLIHLLARMCGDRVETEIG